MIYYKKLNEGGTVAEVGTATERVTDGIEITKEEYDRLHGEIVERAVPTFTATTHNASSLPHISIPAPAVPILPVEEIDE